MTVQYFGGTEEQPACDYDYQPLTTIVEEHTEFFDLTLTAENPDLTVLVLTQPADEAQKAAYYGALIDTLNECREEECRPSSLTPETAPMGRPSTMP